VIFHSYVSLPEGTSFYMCVARIANFWIDDHTLYTVF
jgi:hypothetical protein